MEKSLSLRQVINASGKMTALGGSAIQTGVAQTMAEAATKHVVMEELLAEASKVVAAHTGAEAACVTSGAAAGIVIAVAACITRGNQTLIEAVPHIPQGHPREVVLYKGHNISFGAPIGQMVAAGGGIVREVGQSNLGTISHLEQAVGPTTAAILYVKSHHAVQKGLPSWTQVLECAQRLRVPLIIDAAAEEDIRGYVTVGADMVVYSGGKAIGGPTSGFICGRRDLIDDCLAQYRGIGRPMKIGKEGIMGLLAALELYVTGSKEGEKAALHQGVDSLLQALTACGMQADKVEDEAGRGIPRARIQFSDPAVALGVVKYLEGGNPALYTRNHYLNLGFIDIDPRALEGSDWENIPQLLAQAVEVVKNE